MCETEAAMAYDDNNIFAKILRAEMPCKKVYEDEHVLAFPDIYPEAATHILVIPKGCYTDMDDFTAKATPEEITALFRAVGRIARDIGLDKTGYRVISNCGVHARQGVPHLHIHILGGEQLGALAGK